METKLREYVESLFADAPKTRRAVELKEEILQNSIDRYRDLLSEGKSEEAAYNITVAGIGDVSELFAGLRVDNDPVQSREMEKGRRRSALMLSIAVGLYIISVLPVILLDGTRYEDTLGLALMFIIVAVATGLIIFRAITKVKYQKTDDTVVEDFKEWKEEKRGEKKLADAVVSAVWAVGLAIYFLLSFMTSAWHITWIIFPIFGAISGIVRAIFDLGK